MASAKESMLNTANFYIGKVVTAKNACEAAARNMISAQHDISHNWSGASGNAMDQALNDLRYKINGVYTRLAALESQMRIQVDGIYNSWIEEDPEA